MEEIYVVTVFEQMKTRSINFNSDQKVANAGSIVLAGWFPTLEEAKDILINNKTDLWETVYHYGVIETVPKGMYNFNKEKIYFKYNRENNKYEELPKEEILLEFTSYGFNFCRVGE